MALGENDLRQRRAAARSLVERNTADLRPRHSAEERYAEHWSARGDADPRHDGVAPGPEVLNHRDERDIEVPGRKPVRQPARYLKRQRCTWRDRLELLDQRFGVQVIYRSDAD